MDLRAIVTWLVLGGVAGFFANLIAGRGKLGLVGNVVVGILGALLGGWLFRTFGGAGITGLNLYSIAISVVGALVLLAVVRALR